MKNNVFIFEFWKVDKVHFGGALEEQILLFDELPMFELSKNNFTFKLALLRSGASVGISRLIAFLLSLVEGVCHADYKSTDRDTR
jgi:hypothetical protein